MRLVEIKSSEIVDEETCCVFCGTSVGSEFDYRGCCGEVRSSNFLILANGDMIDENECIILEQGDKNNVES